MSLRYILPLLIFLFASCSESVMNDINRDPSHPAVDAISAKLQLVDAVTSTAFTTLGGSYAWHVASYTEQIFGTGGGQLMYAELRDPIITAAPTTFNNEWNNTYANLLNINQIISKCERGVNAGQKDISGMAKVLKAVDFAALTLLHGDIPYSEAADARFRTPRLDPQLEVYNDLLALIDDAISDLTLATDEKQNNAGNYDFLYGGDPSKWLAFAYAEKARLLLDGLAVYPDVLPKVIEAGETALRLGFKGASLDIFNGVEADNSWAAYFRSRHYAGACATVADLMAERKDPRLDVYAYDMFGTGILYAEAGDATLSTQIDQVGAPAWLANESATIHILSEASLRFILAEAKSRLHQDPTADFAAAVEASFADYESSATGVLPAGSPRLSADASSYVISLGEVTLGEIMVQKYLSQARDEQIETYNDLRRCRAMGEEWVKMRNPYNTDNGANRWPLLLPYGNSDVVSNPNVTAVFGTGNEAGYYIFTQDCTLFKK